MHKFNESVEEEQVKNQQFLNDFIRDVNIVENKPKSDVQNFKQLFEKVKALKESFLLDEQQMHLCEERWKNNAITRQRIKPQIALHIKNHWKNNTRAEPSPYKTRQIKINGVKTQVPVHIQCKSVKELHEDWKLNGGVGLCHRLKVSVPSMGFYYSNRPEYARYGKGYTFNMCLRIFC